MAVNEANLRIGEDHQHAVLTNREVDMMRQLHEQYPQGHPEYFGYRKLCKMFEVSKTTVRRICNYRMRSQAAHEFRKVVRIPDGEKG